MFSFCYGAHRLDLENERVWFRVFIPRWLVLKPAIFSTNHRLTFSTAVFSMNAPTNPFSTPDQAYLKKIRCENRWTAAEDKILFAQVLKGGSLKRREISGSSLTFLKPTVARSAGDPLLPHCQDGTINPAERGAHRFSFTFTSRSNSMLIPGGFIP